ncbi:MAG: MFS transporter [Gammaproteobacteria bacterium]|nr:MFS transporter [Gammaproteobacteria bacterium]
MSLTSPLSFKEKFGYGLGDVASNFFFQVFNLFLLYYYTDVFGLAPAVVGVMFMVTKIVDAISDPVMGMIADRTQTKWGKFRPYLLWMAIPYGLCGFAMFANPDLSDTGKLVYAYVTYTLMMLAYTAINVPYNALMGVISPVSIERTKVASYRFVGAFAAAWIIGTFATPFINILGDGNEAKGFQLTMAIFAVISIALFWVSFATTRERVVAPPVKSDFKADLSALFSNGPWIALFFSAIFYLMNVSVRQGSLLYYFKYFVGDDGTPIFLIFDKTAVFLSSGLIMTILGVMLAKTLCERYEKRSLNIWLTILTAVTYILFFFIPNDMYWLMILVNCIGSIFGGTTPAVVWSMYADTADYGEWKTGRRTTALVFSGAQFAQKMGLAFGAGLSGIILSWFGFIANAAQTPEALNGIKIMFCIFSATLALMSAGAVYFYRLDDTKVQEIETELIAKHA